MYNIKAIQSHYYSHYVLQFRSYYMTIPKSHPRYVSLKTRELIEYGVKIGITSLNGLVAHGRGEAFDYLIGEKTHDFAKEAVDAAASLLLLAHYPVISVNGNTAALVPEELIALGEILNAPLEINLFHRSEERLQNIKKHLAAHGAKNILLPDVNCTIPHLESDRRFVNPEGIKIADIVFVPLEDGDRTEALIKNGKKVITVDLNPLSRTAQTATITIVDNITRALPLLIRAMKTFREKNKEVCLTTIKQYNNLTVLDKALSAITSRV